MTCGWDAAVMTAAGTNVANVAGVDVALETASVGRLLGLCNVSVGCTTATAPIVGVLDGNAAWAAAAIPLEIRVVSGEAEQAKSTIIVRMITGTIKTERFINFLLHRVNKIVFHQ